MHIVTPGWFPTKLCFVIFHDNIYKQSPPQKHRVYGLEDTELQINGMNDEFACNAAAGVSN